MKRLFVLLLISLLPIAPALAQSSFSVTAKVLAVPGLGQTAAASDVGGTFRITNRASLRNDSIVDPGDNMTAYLGSAQYAMPVERILKHTTLPANQFEAYAVAGLGVDKVAGRQHIAAQAGIGLNYDPKASKHYSVNLFELRWARLPGLNQNAVLFSSGVGYSF